VSFLIFDKNDPKKRAQKGRNFLDCPAVFQNWRGFGGG
jgi:hypothetical protein